MSKIGFIFPGQGSQHIGMGKDLYDNYKSAKRVFEEADEALGFSISSICFEGPEAKQILTKNTQPAILTTSVAAFAVIDEMGLKADMVAGHSLGEYSALVAAKALKSSDAVKLVRKRGQLMQEMVPEGRGMMAAIIGLDYKTVEDVCCESKTEGIVDIANMNCPGQVVIAGETKAVIKAMGIAEEKGARRVIPLQVSGPFHTSLMKDVGDKLAEEFDKIEFLDLEIPLVTNFKAELINSKEEAQYSLIHQVSSSVRWEESVERMIKEGVDMFVEVGPRKVLSGLVKRIDKEVQIYNVEDTKSLENTMKQLEK